MATIVDMNKQKNATVEKHFKPPTVAYYLC